MEKALDSTVPEYRILIAVQPIFAGDLHWSGTVTLSSHHEVDELDSHSSDSSSSDESRNEALANCDLGETSKRFQRLMCLILPSLSLIPPTGVREPAFQNCVEKMSRLLKFLNSLVNNDILQHTWTSAQTSSTHTWQARTHRYKRLEAMEMILAAHNEAGQDSPQICRDYICLSQSLKHLNKGIAKAGRVNLFLASVTPKGKRSLIEIPKITEIPVTNWKNKFALEMSNLLFKRLSKTVCKAQEHEAKFQLDGLRLNESSGHPLAFDMFLSPCEPATHWQEVRCTSTTECKTAIESSTPFQAVLDLCGKLQENSYKPQTTLFAMQFHNHYLFQPLTSSEILRYSDGSFLVSLDRLINGDILRSRNGFNANDKATLSLSLAMALLHMLEGAWLQEPWTAERIQFLSNSEEVLDIYRPFITCAVTKSKQAKKTLKSSVDSLEPIMLSFAQLILEIEIGERIPLVAPFTLMKLEATIRSTSYQRLKDNAGGPYTSAVFGCLNFLVSPDQQLDDVTSSDDDQLCRMRHNLYVHVIKPLETSVRLIPEISKSLKSRTMSLNGILPNASLDQALSGTHGLRTVVDTLALKTVPVASMETLPRIIIDGDEPTNTATIQQDMKFSKDFFKKFEEFQNDIIVPKMPSNIDEKSRIKIAILDTGISTHDTTLSVVCQMIKESREKEKYPKSLRDPIRAVESFTDGNGDDTVGHGTHVALMALKAAPHADFYIAKISNGLVSDNTDSIAKAIDWAVRKNVHIINMSVGFENKNDKVHQAIEEAMKTTRPPIFFAGASNGGFNNIPLYPAIHPDVIAMHSLDGHGNDSGGLNPPANPNLGTFGTLGIGITLVWKGKSAVKSGSSYASPIAAGIAANCLQWLDWVKEKKMLSEDDYLRLRTGEGMRYMFKKQATGRKTAGSIKHVAPWNLWTGKQTDENICGVLKQKIDTVQPRKW